MFNKQFPAVMFAMTAVPALLVTGCSARSQTPPEPLGGGPLLSRTDAQMSPDPFLITYGDIRFTDPQNKIVTDPKVRRWLVEKVAAEKPDALLLSGDVPFRGGEKRDYQQFVEETAPWRASGLFVAPALGNHEVNGLNQQQCLENWWTAFPQVRGHRWYAMQLGSRIYALNLDSTSDLTPGSQQLTWIKDQLSRLPATTRFVFFNMHNPPAADNQPKGDADHNERPNELALAAFLKTAPGRDKAQFIVVAGHIHNYERFFRDDIPYLVSGGGGAQPRLIERHPGDLYENAPAVNYHYVRFVLHGNRMDAEMVRVTDPGADKPSWEVKDRFSVAGR
jgi:hypothetical protein